MRRVGRPLLTGGFPSHGARYFRRPVGRLGRIAIGLARGGRSTVRDAAELRPMLIARDSPPPFRQDGRAFSSRFVHLMPSASNQARWPEAILITVALWLFVLLIFLPLLMDRHVGEGWTSVALDASTIPVSMLFAMPMFAVFRRTVELPQGIRALLLIATVIGTAISNTMFDLLFQGLIANHVEPAWTTLPRDLGRAYVSALNYTLIFGVNMALFQVSFARRAALKQELQLSEARSAAQQAQLAALRYQLNPHFLFNALNSISALIVTKRNDDAERMTDKLSSFLRTSLNADPGELVPLEEELSLTEEYLDIESVRFGERLDVSVDCAPGACEALVPSFLVQPLVENAIKHGVAPSRVPVKIDIEASIEGGELCIRVANCICADAEANKAGKKGPARGGVGLVNVRRRLEAVYGKSATLTAGPSENSFVATICIPNIQRAS
jgi:signal transduction histidine kinase